MNRQFLAVAPAGIVLAGGLWAVRRNPPIAQTEPAQRELSGAPAPVALSALPDADAARVHSVREAIAAGSERGHEFRDLVERAALHLTDEELVAALELTVDPDSARRRLRTHPHHDLPRRTTKDRRSILRRWIHLDPEAATAVLPEADISDADRRSIGRNLKTDE